MLQNHYRLLFFLLLMPFVLSAQQKTAAQTNSLVTAIDSFAVNSPVEKVFVHIDKPYYTNTDTIWLKAYILDGALTDSKQSGLLYTELVNDTGRVVIRQAMPAMLGLSWGQIALDSALVPEGSYTLRAYTNWMQNMGEHAFFTRQLYIAKANENTWMVKTGFKTTVTNNTVNTEMALQLTGQDGDPVRLQDLRLRLTDGKRTLLRDRLQTDIDGRLTFNMPIPAGADKQRLTLVAEDAGKGAVGKRAVIPIRPDAADLTDVQFMPEGGYAVAGLTCKVGFKALGADGRGININGVLIDGKGEQVASFAAAHKGMGSFIFTPIAGQVYKARVTIGNTVKIYPFPAVAQSGVTLSVNNIPGRDSLMVAVQATADAITAANRFTIVAQNGGSVYYVSAVGFNGGGVINGRVAKSKFPTGITRFTLFDNNKRPLAERMVFIDHHDQLNINLQPNKNEYAPGDSMAINITVTDKQKQPVSGSFSLAVTDDNQVKADSTNVADITARMLLQSELKGTIEQPGYYFNSQNTQAGFNLDNLLLTQGWVVYDWKKIFYNAKPTYRAEREPQVSGVVMRLNKAQPGLRVNLLSMKNSLLFRDTVTDANGRFTFNNLPRADTPEYLLKVFDKKGKVFEANIETDQFTPTAIKLKSLPALTAWYVNTDSTLLNYQRSSAVVKKQLENFRQPGSISLNEVVIKAKKIVKGSKNLHGAGNADQIIDEEEMIKLDKTPLYDLLVKKIKGFNVKTLFIENPKTFKKEVLRTFLALNEKQLRFIIDGVDIDFFVQPDDILTETSYYNFVRRIIDQFTAEDIRGMEVLYNENYTGRYKIHYGSTFTEPVDAIPHAIPCWRCVPPRYAQSAYLEITTWSGGSIFSKRKHGITLHRPLAISWPKQFYKPAVTDMTNPLNQRATVYWEPNILTDTGGKASVTFFPVKRKGPFTMIIQGSNVGGAVGSTRQTIAVKNK